MKRSTGKKRPVLQSRVINRPIPQKCGNPNCETVLDSGNHRCIFVDYETGFVFVCVHCFMAMLAVIGLKKTDLVRTYLDPRARDV